MKKNSVLYKYIFILIFLVKINTGICQTPCITSINSDNAFNHYIALTDSGNAVSQNFTPACDGNLSSISFSYKVSKQDYPVYAMLNSSANPYFIVDLSIYEIKTGQSISTTDITELTSLYSKSNIEVTYVKPNQNEDFIYTTIATNASSPVKLYAAKTYCLVIQLNADFCNNLIAQKRARLGSSNSSPQIGNTTTVVGINNSQRELLQQQICNIKFATRYNSIAAYCKTIETSTSYISSLNGTSQFNSYNTGQTRINMRWGYTSNAGLVFAVSVTPFLPDIQGSNILCPFTRATLTNSATNGTWTIDKPDIVKIESQNGGAVTIIPSTLTSNGLVKLTYTTTDGTTTKLIRVGNADKPTITPSVPNDGTQCQDKGFELRGVAVNNKALLLDGKSWAQMPAHPALGLTNQLTLEAWVYCSNPSAPQTIIAKGNYDQEMGHYSLQLFDNKIQFTIQTQPGYIVKSPIKFVDAQWHHVAGSYDGDTMRLYIDGEQVNKLFVQTTMIPNNGHLYIGQLGQDDHYFVQYNKPNDYPFTYRMVGQIDEVRIWNICRTKDDIKNNRYKTVAANNTGLVGYYKFNESTNIADPRTVLDYSGSQNNGYLYSSSDNSVTPSALCTAKKVDASIKFGDFSYDWNTGSTTQSIQPTAPQAGYSYSVIDSATGCKATSDAMLVKMNTYATVNKIIPTDTTMPYNFSENGVTITFNDADFTNNVATKTNTSSPTDGSCPTFTTVTVTKSDCPTDQKILSNDGQGRDIASLIWCGTIPSTLKIRGPENSTTISNQQWTVADATIVSLAQSTSSEVGNPRVAFQTLTFLKAGNTSIKCTYNYQSSISCSSTSNITVSPITISITAPSPIVTNAKFTATPADGTWSSSNRNVAAIDQTLGVLTRYYTGAISITYTVDGVNEKKCFNPISNVIAIAVP